VDTNGVRRERLHIAMVVPPYVELPPRRYGGTEAVCAGLVDGLVERGHEVTILGVGRNGTLGRLVASRPDPQPGRMGELMPEVLHVARAARVLSRLGADIVHDHTIAGLLTAGARPAPTVATMHGPVTGELGQLAAQVAPPVHLVAISNSQRRLGPHLPWAGVVHNAIRVRDFPFEPHKDDYAMFLGRSCPEKGMRTAVDVARAAGVPLVIAAKCTEPAEREYFDAQIRPVLGRGITWLGEVDQSRKLRLLSRARCLLFPIDWEEPFGMVLIEALACGTPVVALDRGAVGEIVEHGVTGLVGSSASQLPDMLRDVARLDPRSCRRSVEQRFDVGRLASEYEAVYRRVLADASAVTTRRYVVERHPSPSTPTSALPLL
jgi:glycosyltransferase involved in cell wall biosynthesis